MYTPPARRRVKQHPRSRARRRSIVTELPLQPPAETPPPVLMRPAIQAAWRAELANTMASLHPPVDEMAPTEPTRPLRNAPRGTEPTPLVARKLVALPPPIPISEPEPVVDLRPRAARSALALVALAVAGVGVGLAIAFFANDVDVRVDEAPPPAVEAASDTPAPVVTPLPEPAPADEPAREAAPAVAPEPEPGPDVETEPAPSKPRARAKPRDKPRAKRERKPEPPPAPPPEREFVERVVEDPGFFTVDASPYATVYIDGRKLGDTPVIRHSLSAGKHDVRLVSSEGGTKRFTITIEPGKTLRRRIGAME